MDTPRKFDNSTCFFSSVDGTMPHRPIENQIRIQIVPSVDRPKVELSFFFKENPTANFSVVLMVS